MDNEGDFNLDEFEHLAVAHKPKSHLKVSVDLDKLRRNEPAFFEVDTDRNDLEIGLEEEDDESYTCVAGKTGTAADTVEELAKSDFYSADFETIANSMESIHSEDLILKEVARPGTGIKVPENGRVFLHYVAVCEGADEPCDSTVLRRVPMILDMRNGDALPGFLYAVRSMEVHEVSKFIVRSPLAFGEVGCPPRIPPKADILYIIEVLRFLDEEMLKSPLYMTSEERTQVPFPEILSIADKLRTKGNGCYKNRTFREAIREYRKAIAILEEYPLPGITDEVNRNQLLHTLYANCAQCYLDLEDPPKVCTMCKLGLRSAKGKDSVKLLFRFAKAKFMLKQYQDCVGLCDSVLRLAKDNIETKNLRLQASNGLQKAKEGEKQLYKAMMQQ